MKKFRMEAKSYQGILVLLLVIIASIGASAVSVGAENYSVVTKDWVMDNLQNPNVVFVDTRSFTEYRSGHVPGAVNIEWTYCYDYNGSYKPNDELTKIFETAGVTPDKTVVTYCQAGRRAKAVYDTLCMLGYSQVFVYEGSWAEWSTDPEAPVETTCTLALVGGPKNNTETEGCSSCGGSNSRLYTYVSELTGVDRLLALESALSNSNVTLLVAHFIGLGFIPRVLKANATKIIYENNEGGFSESTLVVIPCKPITSENENVTHAEIFFASEPPVASAASEEIIEGKSWVTAYWVNQTTGEVESVTVDPCDWLCMLACLTANPDILHFCISACACALAGFLPCIPPCIACVLGLGAIGALCTVPCCWAAVKITIKAYPTTDHYSRSHGMSIDKPLPLEGDPGGPWWPPFNEGYEFKVTSKAFTYDRTVDLSPGSHYVDYAASGYVPNYAWHAKIYINGVLKAGGDVGRYTRLRAYFKVQA